jgi:hypothetical protein
MVPQAYVYPADMRATRDVLRRRLHRVCHRAELLTHIQHTKRQDHRPESGQKIAYQANRDAVAERCPDPAVPQSIAVALAVIGHDEALLRDRELAMVTTATPHDANPRYVLQTVPGLGKILRRVLWYAMHDSARCPRVQEFVSDGRLVQCAKASVGQRSGTSGTKIGQADLTWAFSAAAVLCLRNHPAGHKSRVCFKPKHGQGQALSVLAQKLARAV